MTYETGLDVIVVNYRTPEDLNRFCKSFAEHRGTSLCRLHIYNVAPETADRAVAREWQISIPGVSVMESKDNLGYAHAVNSWSRYCRSEMMAIFNADVVLTAGSLSRCYREMMAHPEWGILGPRQIDSQGRVTHAGILGERGEVHTHREWHARQEWLEEHDEDLILDSVVTVQGSAMFVKRACWEELAGCVEYVNYLYEEWPLADGLGAMLPTKLYYEETFLCYHAIEHGWKVVYYGPVTITHEWHKSIDKNMTTEQEHYVIDISKRQFQRACDLVHGMPHV